MSNDEQRRMLCEILTKLVDVLDCDELSLLAHHIGIPVEEFYYPAENQALELFPELKVAA